jgi:hypothetical protein
MTYKHTWAVWGMLSGVGVLTLVAQSLPAQSVRRAKVEISTGATVQVSKAFSDLAHYESLAAGDPSHPGRLVTCSMVSATEAEKLYYQYCYSSFDNGKTWEPTLKINEGWSTGDPAVAYGRGNDVFVVALSVNADRAESRTMVFKSTDGGHTWSEPARFPFIDREFISVDKTGGRYDGRIYVIGKWRLPGINASVNDRTLGLEMFRSLDNGKTFEGPVVAQMPAGSIPDEWDQTMLSDGTVALLLSVGNPMSKGPGTPPNELHLITSSDGGQTFDKSVKIADWQSPGTHGEIAVDPGSRLFRDRLYVVYGDKVAHGTQIMLSYSADKGKTWSKPMAVNDNRLPYKEGEEANHRLPTVSVNKDGVVLVTWYDRRESKDGIGWVMRAAASLDGGETFSASVPLSQENNLATEKMAWDPTAGDYSQGGTRFFVISINSFFPGGGHTTGAAVDSDGIFHPVWIDNRNGLPQIWTSSVKVSGVVVKHGSPDLANLDDVSRFVRFEFAARNFDRNDGTLTITAYLKNISNVPIHGPMKVRVIGLESGVGVAEITNADNGQNGTGAVWDFSNEIPRGTLSPMQLSGPKTLKFHLSDLRPLRALGKDGEVWELVGVDAIVLGKIQDIRVAGNQKGTASNTAEDIDP